MGDDSFGDKEIDEFIHKFKRVYGKDRSQGVSSLYAMVMICFSAMRRKDCAFFAIELVKATRLIINENFEDLEDFVSRVTEDDEGGSMSQVNDEGWDRKEAFVSFREDYKEKPEMACAKLFSFFSMCMGFASPYHRRVAIRAFNEVIDLLGDKVCEDTNDLLSFAESLRDRERGRK